MLNPSKHQHVHALIPGRESQLTISLLLKLTSIRGDSMISALEHYFVHGYGESMCVLRCGIKQQNLNVNIKKLNDVYSIVKQLHGE